MTMLGPLDETREVYGRMVRIVRWIPKRYACDGCGATITDDQRLDSPLGGDWCSIECHMQAPSTAYCWPARPGRVNDWDQPRGSMGLEPRRG